VAIIHAADILPTNGDGTLRIHPAGDLFWASGIEQEESVLMLAPSATDPANREILFVRQPSEHLATWEGEKLTKERATQISGVAKVRWTSELPAVLHALLCECSVVCLNSNEHERAVIEVESRDLRMARRLMAQYPLHRFERLAPILRRLRAVKTPAEVALIRRAADITAAGLERMLAALKPGVMEHELEAELAAEFIRRRGPVNGRFTPRQRAVYDAVLRVLKSSIARTTVGTGLRDWKRAAQVEMARELVGLGLITPEQAERDSADEPACRRYFMHGLGHSLGLGVHDLAPLDGPLEAGWVMTVEPGIYIPEEGFAVRLENDVLVTENGPVDLTSHVPIEPDEIERIMTRHPVGGARV